MKHVTIYTKPTCPFCLGAKEMLTALNVPYEEIDVGSNPTLRAELIEKYHWPTVPIILADGELLGGFDDIKKMHAEGKLLALLQK